MLKAYGLTDLLCPAKIYVQLTNVGALETKPILLVTARKLEFSTRFVYNFDLYQMQVWVSI